MRSPDIATGARLRQCLEPAGRWRANLAEGFVRHKQPWTTEEVQKLHRLAAKGMALKAIGKALTRSEESVQARARQDGLKIAKLR